MLGKVKIIIYCGIVDASNQRIMQFDEYSIHLLYSKLTKILPQSPNCIRILIVFFQSPSFWSFGRELDPRYFSSLFSIVELMKMDILSAVSNFLLFLKWHLPLFFLRNNSYFSKKLLKFYHILVLILCFDNNLLKSGFNNPVSIPLPNFLIP